MTLKAGCSNYLSYINTVHHNGLGRISLEYLSVGNWPLIKRKIINTVVSFFILRNFRTCMYANKDTLILYLPVNTFCMIVYL